MGVVQRKLSKTFTAFFDSEKSSGILLVVCTLLSLALANSMLGAKYLSLWQMYLGGMSVEHWVNDGLMAIVLSAHRSGTQTRALQRRTVGFQKRAAPDFRRIGRHRLSRADSFRSLIPAPPRSPESVFRWRPTSLSRSACWRFWADSVPASLKVFVVAFAVIDDLCAIVVIAVFYTAELSVLYLAGALLIWILLYAVSRFFQIKSLVFFLLGGL